MDILPFEAKFANNSKVKDFVLFCDDVKRQFAFFKDGGYFLKDPSSGIYVNKISVGKSHFMGIICLVDYSKIKDVVLKHEVTKVDKEKEVIKFLSENKTMVKPVLLAYNKNDKIEKLIKKYTLKKPYYEFGVGSETHKYWKISGRDEHTIISLFKSEINMSYIADGHHRFASINYLKDNGKIVKSSGMLSALFSFDQLTIKSFIRVIKIKEDFIKELKKLGTLSIIEKGKIPRNQNSIVFLYRGNWYNFIWSESILIQYIGKLNIELFAIKVLKGIMRIPDERTSARVEYLEGNVTVSDINRMATLDKAYFLFKPISKKQFQDIINLGKYLPPKATWFSPRMRSGLINTSL